MSNTPNELAEEFPQHVERMHQLKTEDAHFAKLFDEYHEVNRAVHRAESRVEVIDESAEETLRRRRMAIKDQIFGYLATPA